MCNWLRLISPLSLLLVATIVIVGSADGAGDSTISVRVGNATRQALLHVPASLLLSGGAAAASATPLVVNWHGMMETPLEQQGLSNMDAVADQHGFIVAYPLGGARAKVLGHELSGFTHNGGGCCSSANTDGVRIDDVAFARALVDAVDKIHPIQRTRVYSTGFSNGGFMSYRLACEASDVFAAVAVVSAVLANRSGDTADFLLFGRNGTKNAAIYCAIGSTLSLRISPQYRGNFLLLVSCGAFFA